MTIGPIQLIAVGFETTERFRGEILRELEALRAKGVIRLIDLLFVAKDATGEVTALEGTWLDEAEKAEFGAAIGALMGLGAGGIEGAIEGAAAGALAAQEILGVTAADAQALADQIPPGTAAALMLFEHTWAIGFSQAIGDAGGRMMAQGFLTREALFMIGEELEARIEAEIAIQEAEDVKAQALLEALSAVVAAEMIEEAAAEEAAIAIEVAAAIKAAAAADAVRALIVADLIEEAAAERALEALVAAELIEAAALEAATTAIEQA